MDFIEALAPLALLADGAMGTRLMERGAAPGACLEELCVCAPDAVRAVHEEYLVAGARLIRTDSFGANAVRLAAHGLGHRVSEINWSAAQLARDVARGSGAFVAASMGPLGITAEQAAEQRIDRAAVFAEQMGALLDGGVRIVMLETFLDVEELLIALEVKHSLHHCPVICSLALTDAQLAVSDVGAAFVTLRAAGADVVGINCVNGPLALADLFEKARPDDLCSAFPNAGLPGALATPEQFAHAAVRLAEQGVRLIGGCCGTGPAHIAAASAALAARDLSEAP